MVAAAVIGGGAISGISGLVGASESASAQESAAQQEAAATEAAIEAEQSNFQTGLGYTSPYATEGALANVELGSELGTSGIGVGNPAYGSLDLLPSLTDMTQLPGYSFTLQQGENAVNDAASATGQAAVPGSGNYSGAQAKGNINYAEELANTYYNNYLQNYWTNQNNRYNMLAGISNQGLGAATSIQGNAVTAGGQEATTGVSGATAANNYNVGAANTSAAGLTGAGNSLSGNLLLASALGNTGSTLSSNTAAGVNTDYGGGGDVSSGYYGTG